jgi:hypothetical protein
LESGEVGSSQRRDYCNLTVRYHTPSIQKMNLIQYMKYKNNNWNEYNSDGESGLYIKDEHPIERYNTARVARDFFDCNLIFHVQLKPHPTPFWSNRPGITPNRLIREL